MKKRGSIERQQANRKQPGRSRPLLLTLVCVILVGGLFALRAMPPMVRAMLQSRPAVVTKAAALPAPINERKAAPSAKERQLSPLVGNPGVTAYGVTASGALFRFQTDLVNTVTTIGNMGIVPEGIDFRPGSTQLYAIDVGATTTQLYTVNTSTAAVTPVGSGFPSQVMGVGAYNLVGQTIGFDFNPRTLQPDGSMRIRLVASGGSNLRLNSMTGLVAAVDTPLQYAMGDLHAGQTPNVDACAYINSAVATDAAGGTTLLYDIDYAHDNLVTQNPVNNGTLNTVGNVGITIDVLPGVSFDIFSASTTDDTNDDDFGYAVFTRGFIGDRPKTDRQVPDGLQYLLYDINLDNGQVTNGRTVGGGLDFTGGFAVQPQFAGIKLVKITNNLDNDTAPGPIVMVGSTVSFTYNVTNTGTIPLSGVTVRDDNGTPANLADDFNATFFNGDDNSNGLLDGPNETWIFTASRIATAGQYTNIGTATGTPTSGGGSPVTSTNPDNHFGASPGVNLVKLTNGTNNDTPPGPTVPIGSTVTFTYVVTNPGNVPLFGVTVRDDNGTPANMADDFNPTFVGGDTNSNNQLDTNETWTYTASRIATAGQYTNTGTVTAFGPNESQVSDTDVDNHFGANPNITISINDVSQAEGNTGAGTFTSFNFTVSLSASSAQTITVAYQSANGTAFAAEDYLPSYGTVTFNPGETAKPVAVLVNAETLEAVNETFFVNLSNPTNATIADGQGLGTIINDDPVANPDEPPPPHAFAITNMNQLLSFNVADPGVILSRVNITGLVNGESVIGIDFRPADGRLYGFTGYNRIVTINTATGVATPVASLSTGLLGNEYGMDFNPTNDRLRLVNDNDQNASVDPTNGTTTLQTPLNPGNPNITGVAYTNNFAGAATTTLYAIDSATDTLYTQNPPASGTLTAVGPLGVNTGAQVGFDVTPTSAVGYASLTRPLDNGALLYAMNLTTGQALLIGQIGDEVTIVRDITVSTIAAPTVFGLTPGNNLVTFNALTPEIVSAPMPITGLIFGETVIAIDFRPATGQLFGFTGYNRVVTINPANGAATALSTPVNLVANEYGFDFNPAVDRIRMVNDSDNNVRLNPDTGALAGTDTNLAYAPGDPNFGQNPSVAGSAYTNNFVGAATTTLYGIDSERDALVTQGSLNGTPTSPNTGQLFTIGSLGFNASNVIGFDIAAGTGAPYAALQPLLGGFSSLYAINLLTGRATLIGQIGGVESYRDIAVAPAGTFQFPMPVQPVSVAENAGSVTLTVIRTGNTALTYAAVSFETVAGTATAPGDYTATTGTVFFNPGETSKMISIPITDDVTAEMAETFTVRLIGATSGYFNNVPHTVTVTINDND